jgi:hypothetical protein
MSAPDIAAVGVTSVFTAGGAGAAAAAATPFPLPSAVSADAYSTLLARAGSGVLFSEICARQTGYIEAQPAVTNRALILENLLFMKPLILQMYEPVALSGLA